jgi:hypothetical protein
VALDQHQVQQTLAVVAVVVNLVVIQALVVQV